MSITRIALLAFFAFVASVSAITEDGDQMIRLEPADIKVESIDLKKQKGGGIDPRQIMNLFVKVYIRDKVLKKKDIYTVVAELEEELAEEEMDFENMNVREEKWI